MQADDICPDRRCDAVHINGVSCQITIIDIDWPSLNRHLATNAQAQIQIWWAHLHNYSHHHVGQPQWGAKFEYLEHTILQYLKTQCGRGE